MTPQTLIHEIVPEAVAHALGWTLLHSLWQGVLLALLLAVLLRLMHRHSAAIRYRVACLGLLAMLVVSAITYSKLYSPGAAQGGGGTVLGLAPDEWQGKVLAAAPAPPVWENLLSNGKAYFDQHLPAVVVLWLVGMLLMGFRLLGGWVYVQRLRSYRTNPVPDAWVQKAQDLSQRLGCRHTVRLAESALIQVPMVIGHFAPLVLLPLGTLVGLSGAQVEAILAHELAHVKRRDYLLNLLQSVVETLFFFHPAVWWMSECVRTEREHACDDLALSLCGDSLTYAYALTNLEEMMMKKKLTSPRLAVAFSGRRRSLLSRITRLVQKPALRPSFSEGFLASCALVAGLLVFSASAHSRYPVALVEDQKEASAAPALTEPLALTPPAAVLEPAETEVDLFLQEIGNGLVIVQNKKGKVVELYVNGRRVPKKDIAKYQARIDEQLAAAKNGRTLRDRDEINQAMELAEASLERIEDGGRPAGRLRERVALERREDILRGSRRSLRRDGGYLSAPPAPLTPPSASWGKGQVGPVPPVPPVPPVAPVAGDEKGQKAYEKSLKEYQARMQEFNARMQEFHARQEEFVKRNQQVHVNRMQDHEVRQRDHSIRMEEHTKRLAEHAVRMKDHEKRMEEHGERMKKHEAMMKELKAALVADGFIKSEDDDYEFKLDKTGLYINDKKQSDSLFEKYKKIIQTTTGEDVDLMLKKDGSNFIINSNSSSKTK